MKGKHMSFNLNNFVNFMDQVKDKDWVDDHVIIDGVSPEFQKQIKDKIRERLKDDTPKGSKTKRLEVQEL
jgi:pantothenate kinase